MPAGAGQVRGFVNVARVRWPSPALEPRVGVGDLHLETMAIVDLLGGHPVVPRSLNFVRDASPVGDAWMNGMPTYSRRWIITWRDWLLHTGDHAAIEANRPYLTQLLDRLVSLVADDGRERLPARFLDRSMATDDAALAVGARALMRIALNADAELCGALRKPTLTDRCESAAGRLARWQAPPTASQQAKRTRFAPDPMFNLAPFYRYRVLEARALAGDHAGCLDLIRRYWGGMLDFDATTFWEHFDAGWDRPRPARHRPTQRARRQRQPLLQRFPRQPVPRVLGRPERVARPASARRRPHCRWIHPGARAASAGRPNLGARHDPTPFGPINVSHERPANGEVRSRIDVPDGVVLECCA